MYSVAIFSKENKFEHVKYIKSFDEFIRFGLFEDSIFTIIEGGELSYNQARYIKESYGIYK